MKVLMIGGDKRSLESGTVAASRLMLQRSVVDRLDVFVWPHIHSIGAIIRASRAAHYDVITAQDPFWRGLIALIAARLSHARLNVQVHTDLKAYRGVRRMLAQRVLRHADSIRVVSEDLKTQVAAMGARGMISVLPVFVDLSPFRAVVREPHTGKQILWIGRFEAEKDPLYAVEVFKRVHALMPDTRLTMIGAGSLNVPVSEVAANLPIQITGWQNDLVPHMAAADLVLCTSKHESWGQSILEALAAGIPVVAPDVGIAREAGAIVAPREALAEHVVEVLKSGTRGALRLHLPDAQTWALSWKRTL